MDTFSSDIEHNKNSLKSDLGIVIAVLDSGNSVELTATGYSMFPTLRQGDRVIVRPVAKGEVPAMGSVVVCVENGTTAQRRNGATEERHNGIMTERPNGITTERYNGVLVMHRLVEIEEDDSGKLLFITRGDSGMENDKPWPHQQLMGVAVSYRRGEKEHLVKTFIPGAWRYKYNRRLLWMFGKIKRLNMGPGKLLKSK